MFWVDPTLKIKATGRVANAATVTGVYLGRQWQRWSRHLGPGAWKPGIDGLANFLAVVDRELAAAVA